MGVLVEDQRLVRSILQSLFSSVFLISWVLYLPSPPSAFPQLIFFPSPPLNSLPPLPFLCTSCLTRAGNGPGNTKEPAATD